MHMTNIWRFWRLWRYGAIHGSAGNGARVCRDQLNLQRSQRDLVEKCVESPTHSQKIINSYDLLWSPMPRAFIKFIKQSSQIWDDLGLIWTWLSAQNAKSNSPRTGLPSRSEHDDTLELTHRFHPKLFGLLFGLPFGFRLLAGLPVRPWQDALQGQPKPCQRCSTPNTGGTMEKAPCALSLCALDLSETALYWLSLERPSPSLTTLCLPPS